MMSISQKKVDTSPQPALSCKKLNIAETDEAEITVMMLLQRARQAENGRKTSHQMDR